jgi:hypothetical protein
MSALSDWRALDFTAPATMDVLSKRALVVGVIFGIGSLIGLILSPAQFLRSYLLGYMWALGLTLGALAILMLYHLTGGAWGYVLRRVLEAATRTLPLMIVLWIPILLGVHSLYVWSRPEELRHNQHLVTTLQYLSLRWFIFRAVLYFVVWLALAYFLNWWSAQQDAPPEKDLSARFRRIGAPGLIIYFFTITFAVIDWIMSLNPEWTSTVYALIYISGQALFAICFGVIILFLLTRVRPMADFVKPDQFHDQGKLMLTFVMLWGYTSFSQWLIMWAGNLPDEITWYYARTRGGWQYVGLLLMLLHFAVPFALLLGRDLKRDAGRLIWVAGWLILMRWLDLFWFIEPNFPGNQAHFHFSWLDAVVPITIAGLWLAYFFWNLRRRPVVPLYDPHLRIFLGETGEH